MNELSARYKMTREELETVTKKLTEALRDLESAQQDALDKQSNVDRLQLVKVGFLPELLFSIDLIQIFLHYSLTQFSLV